MRDYIINASAGIFVADGLKLAVEPAFEIRSYDNSSSSEFKLYLTPEYVFNLNSEIYPFIGGSVGYTSLSSGSAENGFSWGVKGGIKINPLGNVLINVGISYYQETYNYTDGYLGDVTQHYNILGLKGGLSLFFR
jgi:opacity protein-like surface antigen